MKVVASDLYGNIRFWTWTSEFSFYQILFLLFQAGHVDRTVQHRFLLSDARLWESRSKICWLVMNIDSQKVCLHCGYTSGKLLKECSKFCVTSWYFFWNVVSNSPYCFIFTRGAALEWPVHPGRGRRNFLLSNLKFWWPK